MSRKRWLWIFLLMHGLSQNARPQQYFFSNYTLDDGLSNNSITCIAKDGEGFLWAGTYAGLNRFNGYDFTVYKSLAGDSSTLPSNVIYNLLTDSRGILWIGTAHGICRYEKKKNSFQRVYLERKMGERFLDLESNTLFEDSKKNFWAATGSGLMKYNEKRGCFEKLLDDLPVHAKDGTTSLTEDADGSLWILNYGYLLKFNEKSHQFKEFENKIGQTKFQALKIHPDETDPDYLWITSWGNGLVRFNKQSGEYVSYKFHQNASPNLDNIIFDLVSQPNRKIWLATNRGVFVFDVEKKIFSETFRDSINQNPLVNGQAHNIYKDQEGIVWIGSAGGLCNIHPAKQQFINQPLWMNTPVSDYFYDESNGKFYGTRIYENRALLIFDKRTNKVEAHPIPEADANKAEPFAIAKDTGGLIWIGTTKGIYTFDEKQKIFSLFEIEKQLHLPDQSVFINDIVSDRNGNLWFTCYSKGMMMLDPVTKKITTWFHSNEEPSSFPLFAIRGMVEGKGNTMYACDERNGIAILDYVKKEWVHFDAHLKEYSALTDPTDIAVDNTGCIWVTTKNNGLVCIDAQRKVTAYTKDDFGNIIDEQGSIVLDDAGKLWLTSSNGIYRFDPVLHSFTHFTYEDGLPARSIDHPLVRLPKGIIAYQYYKGIYAFDPGLISKARQPLETHITSVLINGKPPEFNSIADRLDTLVLLHTENNLTVEFAAINFNNASATVYSCRLDGIDKDWSAPTQTRIVNYAHLDPGDYRLRIRAGSNSSEKQLFIQVVPAWWQTNWFRWTVVLGSVACIVWIIRFFLSLRYKQKIAQLERLQEMEAMRSRISRDIHDEIGSGLTKIKLMSRNLMKKAEGKSSGDLPGKISATSDELIQNMGEIVWTINPANDTLSNIVAYIRNYLSRLLELNPEISFKLELPEPAQIPENSSVNPELKRNLILIVKEALTNILKHSKATRVDVALTLSESEINLGIRDNGTGLAISAEGNPGNGLRNMRNRAEAIQAKLEITSTPGDGTAILLIIPVR